MVRNSRTGDGAGRPAHPRGDARRRAGRGAAGRAGRVLGPLPARLSDVGAPTRGRRTPARARARRRTLAARRRRSRAPARRAARSCPRRGWSARACAWRRSRRSPGRRARARSRRARSATRPDVLTLPSGCGKRGTRTSSPSRSRARSSSSANASASSTGLVKNEPAETESGSPGSITMPLRAAQREHRPAHVGQRRALPLGDAERARQLGVADRLGVRSPARSRKRHGEHDPAAGRALERARAVGEAALGGRGSRAPRRRAVVRAHGDDRLGDLLPVGADVLDRRRADRARDARQALDARRVPPRRSARRAGPTARPRPPRSTLAVHAARRATRSRTTVPGKPASATTRFEPPASTSSGCRPRPPRARRRSIAPSSAASTSRAAGPPRRSVVRSARAGITRPRLRGRRCGPLLRRRAVALGQLELAVGARGRPRASRACARSRRCTRRPSSTAMFVIQSQSRKTTTPPIVP